MIHLSNIDLIYGEQYVLKNISLSIKDKDKIGLVGRNGAGKSSLFRIISGIINPTNGSVNIEGSARLGILRQDIELPSGVSAKEECLSVMDELNALNDHYHQLEKEIASREDYESSDYAKLLDDFSFLSERISNINPDKIEAEIERVLKGLGFTDQTIDKKLELLSGGWRMRVELAKILVRKPEFILLDEPNNHLDIYSIIWLEKFIADYHGCVIVISHDSTFLNNAVHKILEIENGKVDEYDCNYTQYLVEKEMRQEKLRSAFLNQQKVIAEKERTINRFIAKATKTKMAQSMRKQLEKMERVEYEEFNAKKFNLQISYSKRSGLEVFHLNDIGKNYGPLEVIDQVNLKILRGEKVAYIGQNGQGKSTLVKLMLGIEDPTKGSITTGVNTDFGYYAQNQEETLNPKLTVLETLEQVIPEDKRTKSRAILGSFLFSGEDTDKKVSVLSGGERARLAMACMFCKPLNVLILDEPTNHLDIPSKTVLKDAIKQFDGTIVLVSHDREFMGGWLDKVFAFRNGEVKEFLGGINDYLLKEGLKDMREVEKKEFHETITEEDNDRDGQEELSRDELKKIKRKIQYLERDLEKLEEQKSAIEEQLMDPDIFKGEKGHELTQQHADIKEKIASIESEWELWCGKL